MSRAAQVLLVLAAVSASCEAAAASTVSIGNAENQDVIYAAGPGERNELRVETDGLVVTVRDPGADIQASTGCDFVNPHKATCNRPGTVDIVAILGGEDDEARIVGPMLSLSGQGQGGEDRLAGGPFVDRLDGGAGPDLLKGRAGQDFVIYADRSADVRVTVADGERNDGGVQDGAKRDRLSGIENAVGGTGDDLLVGGPGENTLSSGEGRDVLRGRSGPDSLNAGEQADHALGQGGADLFSGGLGDDITAGGGGADHFQMGAGGPNGSDLYRGGPGHDTLQGVPFGAIRVTLNGNADDGICADPACTASDEGDDARVEEILAGNGDDLLVGSGRDEVFRPSQGADQVRARGGDDTVHVAMDGASDLIDCGPGIDSIVGSVDATDMNPNCE